MTVMSQSAAQQSERQQQQQTRLGVAQDFVLQLDPESYTVYCDTNPRIHKPQDGSLENNINFDSYPATLNQSQTHPLTTFKAKVNDNDNGPSDDDNSAGTAHLNNNKIMKTNHMETTVTTKPGISSRACKDLQTAKCNNLSAIQQTDKLITRNSLESLESKCSNDFDNQEDNADSSTNNATTTTTSDNSTNKIASLADTSSDFEETSNNTDLSNRPQDQNNVINLLELKKHNHEEDRPSKQHFYEIELGGSSTTPTKAPAKDIHPVESPIRVGSPQKSSSGGNGGSNNGEEPNNCDVCFAKGRQRRLSTRSLTRFQNAKPPFKFAGIVVSLIGSVCFCISALCIKLMPENSPDGLQEKVRAVAVRGFLFMILCGATLYYQKSTIRVKKDEIWVNVMRCFFGCVGIIGSYVALCYIALGDASALVNSSPVWTSLLSYFILGEPLVWMLLLALPASIVGILLIAHPAVILDFFMEPELVLDRPENVLNATLGLTNNMTASLIDSTQHIHTHHPIHIPEDDGDSSRRWIGISIALATSLCVSGAYIVLKFRKTTKIQTTTFWLGASSCLVGIIAMCFTGFGELPNSTEALLLFTNGFFAWLAQTCMQWGLYYENASVLSVVRTSDVAISFVLSALFLSEDIYWTSVLGAAIIAVVVVLMVLNNWIKSKPTIYADDECYSQEHKFRCDDLRRSSMKSSGGKNITKPNGQGNAYTMCCDERKGEAAA